MHLTRSHSSQLAALVAFASVAALHSGCSKSDRVARLIEQAHRYYEAGEFDKAEIEYKNVLQKSAQNAEAIARLGLLYHEQGRDGRAVVFLLKARELQPENLVIRQKLALAQLASGGLADARQEAIQLLERKPNDEVAPLILAETSFAAKDLEDARLRLLALNAHTAKLPNVLVGLGQVAIRQNRLKEAELSFRDALAMDANCVGAHSSIALIQWGAKNLDGAEASFKRAAELSPMRSPKRLQYATFKRQTGDLAAGKQIASEVTQKAPDYLPAWTWLADTALAEKKLDEAEAHVAKALAREALAPDALMASARIRLARGEPAKAVDELERMLGYYPRSPQIAYQLGLAHVAAGDTAKAIARLSQLHSASPEFIEAGIALAEVHLRKRDYSAAVTVLKPLCQQRPDALGARMLLAEANRGVGNLDEAGAIYAELSQKLPQDAGIAYARGTVYWQQNRLSQARAEFMRARQLQPTHAAALEHLVELDLRERQPAAARQRLEPEIARNPNSASLAFLLSKVCAATNDLDGYEAALKRTIELDPANTAAHYQLSKHYTQTKRQDAAIAALKEATTKTPQTAGPHVLLGVLLDEKKDYSGARDAYEKALAIDPKLTLALNNLAYLYLEHFNQPEKALEFAQRARAILPLEPRIADTLGWALVKKKSYAQAVPLLMESANRLPDEPDIHYHLGVAQYNLGDEAAAINSLQRALTLNASFAAAADARQRLEVLRLDPATATAEARAAVEKRLAAQPEDTIAQLRRADFTRRSGDATKALALYKTLLQANPKHAIALLDVAEIHAAKKELPAALESAKAARSAAPGNTAIAHRVGRIAFEAGDHRWASSLLQDAAKSQPDNAEVLLDWAESAYSVGRVSDAETSMRRALELAPSSSRAGNAKRFLEMLALGQDKARAAAARNAIDAALKADPQCAPALFALGLASESQSDTAAARQAYESLLGRFSEFSPAQRNLAILYAAGPGDLAKASALAAKARQAFPRDPELNRASGIVAYRQNEFAKTVSLLQEFAARDTRDSEALYYLGMAQCRLNKLADGRKTLQRALDLGLAETLAAEAKKRLVTVE